MSSSSFDVLGIGNAIVDIISPTEEDFLVSERIQKGGMTLIDEIRAEHLYGRMGPATVTSGGVRRQHDGGRRVFRRARLPISERCATTSSGVCSATTSAQSEWRSTHMAATAGPWTARCMIFVTPDGERSMNTYLGACQNLRQPISIRTPSRRLR